MIVKEQSTLSEFRVETKVISMANTPFCRQTNNTLSLCSSLRDAKKKKEKKSHRLNQGEQQQSSSTTENLPGNEFKMNFSENQSKISSANRAPVLVSCPFSFSLFCEGSLLRMHRRENELRFLTPAFLHDKTALSYSRCSRLRVLQGF